MRRLVPALLAAAFIIGPLDADATDLVVWWEQGFYPEEDAAVAELVAAFEHKTGKQVDLVQHPHVGHPAQVQAALAAGHPPDFLWGFGGTTGHAEQWAYEGRLVDLTETLGFLRELFDQDLLERATLFNERTGERGLYTLPMGRNTNHLHVWQSLLERAGFTLADIPKEWDAFWSFWCERVQPAMRKALGRDDIYGVGLPMSMEASDTQDALDQFLWAYTPHSLPPAKWNLVETPSAHVILVQALERYTAIYKNGCTPPDAVDWTNLDNNTAFLEQRVVMVPNPSLSIPNMLRQERPEDYSRNAATIEWPRNTFGEPLIITGGASSAVVFEDGGHSATAKEFVRFLVEDGWLAHYLDFSRDRLLPPMRKLIDRPYWLDPSDPHRMRSAMQILTQPQSYGWWGVRRNDERRFDLAEPPIMRTAVHRVAVEGWSAERAADEAIARIKQILAE